MKMNKTTAGGLILIVDDDPVVAGMLGISLAAAGYEIVEANSGEEALALFAAAKPGQLPDMVFLDIEMGMGIDGFDTCRSLRSADASGHLPIIFLSGHDELDTRLLAYDAGGSDFMAKPFVPDEVLRKASLAVRHKRQQEAAEVSSQTLLANARSAMNSLGDSGAALQFSRGALGCRSLRALAQLIIESMAAFGIACHVQLRTQNDVLTLTLQGHGSPLEESVIERMRTMDRIFSFKNRLIINYDNVSLLITDMPIKDEELCGRIRDQAAMIAEVAELAVGNIELRTDMHRRTDEMGKLAETSRSALEELRSGYRGMQVATRLELENLANSIEGMYMHLGLTNRQEFTISDTVRASVDRVLTLFESSQELDRNFAGVIDSLTRAGEYKIAREDEPAPTIELF